MANEFKPTHLNKVYWPAHARSDGGQRSGRRAGGSEKGYTKGDLIEYYSKISPFLLPYLKDRPLVMKRFPEGVNRQSFFQKDVVDEHMPKFVKMVTIPAKTIQKDVHYIVCNNEETLFYMANLGAIELHPWGSRIRSLNKPDFMIFDLDPGEETTFDDVIKVTHVVKEILDELKIDSYVKTSGKRGLHVFVSVGAKYTYETVRGFARHVAEIVVARHSKLASLAKHPIDRKDKIFVDYLRNSFGQTAIAPYCPRATPSATVSTPLDWSEVRKGLDPKKFTILTMSERLRQKGDLWSTLLRGKTIRM